MCGRSGSLLPVVRLRNDVEQWRGRKVAYPCDVKLNPEEVRLLSRILVQSIERLPVFLADEVAIQTIVDAAVPAA